MAFVNDDTDMQYVFCTRRAAKSYSGALKAFREAMRRPRCSVLIAGMHRDEVKRTWWLPILKDIDEKRGIGCKFNESELSCTLPNRSVIYLLGMDADEKQKRKALGQKYPLVIIDEAQDWYTDLTSLVYSVLKPAVADYNGTICLLGTPGLVARGLFFDVTTGKEGGWKRHEWTTYQNTTRETPDGPTMAERWDAEIRKLKATKAGVELTPWFRRNYLREWVVDDEALVYRYSPERNDVAALPAYRQGTWRYVLGCDLGHTDETSFVVGAYHDYDKAMYFVKALTAAGLDVTEVANRAKALDRIYSFDAWVVDGANKQAVEEMRRRHDIPWRPADKRGKADFIELMNAEFLTGGIRVVAKDCAPLVEEYRNLVWDMKLLKTTGKREEHPNCKNHAADGGLYNWRYCYPYLAEALPGDRPKAGSPEWLAQAQQRAQSEVDEQLEKELDEATEAQRQKEAATWDAGQEWME